MSKIRVNTDVLWQQQQQLEQIAKELSNISGEIAYVKTNLSWKISSREQIQAKLNDYSNYVGNMRERTKNLAAAMQSVSEQYQETEKKLGAVSVQGSSRDTSESKENESKDDDNNAQFDWKWASLIWGIIGNGGNIGALIAWIGQMTTGGESDGFKRILKNLKNFSSLVGKLGKTSSQISKSSFDWRTLFGLETRNVGDIPQNFWEALEEEVGKLKLTGAKNVGDKISVMAKWAGYALTGILTTYDNFTDEENTTFARKLAESIGETTIKIGEGIGLAALAAMIMPAGAPAIVISGSVVVATWAIDRFCEQITDGKDFAEFFSDAFLDGAKNLMEQTGAQIKNAGEKISGWWNKIFGKQLQPAF